MSSFPLQGRAQKKPIDSPLEQQAASRAFLCVPFSSADTHERTHGSFPAVSTVSIPQSEAAILIGWLVFGLGLGGEKLALSIYIFRFVYTIIVLKILYCTCSYFPIRRRGTKVYKYIENSIEIGNRLGKKIFCTRAYLV